MNVGLVMRWRMPRPRANPCANVVLPAPRSPINATTVALRGRNAPARQSFGDGGDSRRLSRTMWRASEPANFLVSEEFLSVLFMLRLYPPLPIRRRIGRGGLKTFHLRCCVGRFRARCFTE